MSNNMQTLTKRQKQILDFIGEYIKKHSISPTFEEIKKHFRLSALSTIHQHTEALINKRYLVKNNNLSRGLKIKKTVDDFIQIPLKGTIAAGQPIEAIEERETIAVPKINLPKTSDLFALRVSGDSMIGENINDGDIVIIKSQSTADNGQKVVALIDNYEVTLKKIYKEKGRICLQPANARMSPLYVKPENLMIQGIVIDVIKNITTELQTEKKQTIQYKNLPLNQIICGDAVKIMQAMPPCSIDLAVTSPPYDELRNYNGYTFNFEGMAKGLFRVMKKGGVVVWVVGDKINKGNKSFTSFKQALFFQSLGFNAHDVMIYRKKNTPFMRSNAYTNCYEFMFVFSKGSPKTFNPLKTKTVRQGQEMLPFNKKADGINKKMKGELKPEKTLPNIWDYAVGFGGSTSDKIAFQHTAIFPEKLAGDHILSWTVAGDVVFDPMCGSGTTCKMAAINKRYYIGCDISKEYVELSKKRLKYFNL
jgi:site-specific DNA-methyltransferase (adenine-specific)